jgi:hypothetical protein
MLTNDFESTNFANGLMPNMIKKSWTVLSGDLPGDWEFRSLVQQNSSERIFSGISL